MFSGGFDLSAAEEVGSGDGIDAGQVVDLLASLVDASMVTVGTTEGRVRYSLLETLRAYGWSHLSSQDEADTVRLRHASHFASVAEQADLGLRGPDEAAWVTIVDRELGNLRAAHQWLVRTAQVELALRLSRGLHYYMLFRFRDEVVSWGQVTLELPGAEQHPLFAEVCGAVGEGLTARGEMGLARALADRALTQVDGPDDERRMFGLRLSGMVALYVGRLEDGFRDHAEMLRLARLHDHPYETGMALLGLAQARTYAGAPEEGLAFAEEQYRVVQPLGNPSMLALAWYDQAEALVHARTGAGDRAVPASHRSRRLGGGHLRRGNRARWSGLAARTLGRPQHRSPAVPFHRRSLAPDGNLDAPVDHATQPGPAARQDRKLGAGRRPRQGPSTPTAPTLRRSARMPNACARPPSGSTDRLGTSSWSAAIGRGASMSDQDTVTFACETIDRAAALLPHPEQRD